MLWMALIIYLVWCGLLYFMQDSLVFPRAFAGQPAPRPFMDGVVELDINQGDQRVPAWLFLAPSASEELPAPVAIFFHGNAELIDHQAWIVDGYHAMGISVLLPEFRGYGRAQGKPSQKAIVEDAMAFYDQVVAREDVDGGRVIIHGRSIGAAVAAQVAAKRGPDLLILQSCPKNITSFAWKYGVPPVIVTNPFRADKVIPGMDCPILFFHGSEDTIVPPANTAVLEKLAKDGRRVTYPVGHNDFPGQFEREHWLEIEETLRDAGLID